MNIETIILGGGCFWCIEAIFQRVKGVVNTQTGYAGGREKDPSHREVSYGKTLHAEVVKIHFNTAILPLEDLLFIFFEAHDPTTLNQQGADIGPQYRSIIFYSNEQQKKVAEHTIKKATDLYMAKIITELKAYKSFYPSQSSHQNFYNDNQQHPYCQAVIKPKLEHLKKYLR